MVKSSSDSKHVTGRRRTRLWSSVLALSCLVTGCDQQQPHDAAGSKPTAAATVSEAPKSTGVPARPQVELKITWDASAPWVKQTLERRDVRRAAYAFPKLDGDAEDAELGVYYFGRSVGGGVEANLKRWAAQFGQEPQDGKTTKRRFGALDVTLFEIAGTYQPGRPMAPKPPKPGFAMVAAIAHAESSGNYFFKLTGPKKTVDAARADFMKLLESLKEKAAE